MNHHHQSQQQHNQQPSSRSRQPQPPQQQSQYMQSQQSQSGVNLNGIQQLLSGIPELQNLMNFNQLVGGQQQPPSSSNSSSQSHHQHQSHQSMGAHNSSSSIPPQYSQQARPPQQVPSQEVNVVLNDHNAGFEVTEQDAVQSLTINGHNNQVAIQEGVSVPCVLANGHNNFICSQVQGGSNNQGCENFGRIERLIVQGHNNRYESLVAKEIEVFGHNNQFSEIYCQNLVDQGQNNKFRHLFKLDSAQQQQTSSQNQQRNQQNNQNMTAGQQAAMHTNERVRQQMQAATMQNMAQAQASRQQQAPQYEFSTDEEAEFEEYGIQDPEDGGEHPDLDIEDDDEHEDLIYEDSDDGELEDGNPSEYSSRQYQPQNYMQSSSNQQQQRPQMQNTLTLNINGQPIQINQNSNSGQAGHPAAATAMENIQLLSNFSQLNNVLEQINPGQFMGGQQQNQGFGGTFFTQDANNGGYYSSNGHTINIQGPGGGNIHVAVNDDGQAYYVDENDEHLLDEFPDDREDGLSEQDQFYDDENLDSDGEPLPSAEEIKDIINSIPSYKFEEAPEGHDKKKQQMMQAQNNNSAQDSFTERKRKEIKRQEKEVSCSICLEVLRTGAQVKQLHCRHVFHTSCIHSWLKQKLQCPNCKKKVRL